MRERERERERERFGKPASRFFRLDGTPSRRNVPSMMDKKLVRPKVVEVTLIKWLKSATEAVT